ncbi:hypothetical protein MKX01_015304 [Papaver californicum]|nr:hypothetical protein MKX01_015304 [Papaver californicum]
MFLREMLKLMLGYCKVYISESRNKAALVSIEKATKLYPGVAIVNKFGDEAYNRVGYTIVYKFTPNAIEESGAFRNAVVAMVKAAFDSIDLELHCATHPRLGVVDHICFHPLAQTSLDETAWLAKSVATDIGSSLQVPTFLYGAAHQEGKRLDLIRRQLGYFKPNYEGNQWVGALGSNSLPLKPDEGPHQATPTKGVVIVGATQWIDNYNVPIFTNNIAVLRRISKWVSGRGGGLPSVQAMALAHDEDIIEVACNLLEPGKFTADQVQHEVERLAIEEGMTAGKGYYTDFSQEKISESYLKLNLVM